MARCSASVNLIPVEGGSGGGEPNNPFNAEKANSPKRSAMLWLPRSILVLPRGGRGEYGRIIVVHSVITASGGM